MRKLLISTLLITAGSVAAMAQTGSGGITASMLTEISKGYEGNASDT